ncbi:MAG: nucleotidyltransferase domain-containing protein [Sulfuritalea sp.]|jgi:predicted nucleotidyltransferase|nr:nucleotidyltransferase domain-containing protein [Sulfuritalea sp.]
MRVPQQELQLAVQLIRKHLGSSSDVWLFGSRVDDGKKGGDIDLYVETDKSQLALPLARARGELADVLGRHVDLVVNNHTCNEPIFDIAKAQGVRLT